MTRSRDSEQIRVIHSRLPVLAENARFIAGSVVAGVSGGDVCIVT